MFVWMVGWCNGLRQSGLLSKQKQFTNHFVGLSDGSMCMVHSSPPISIFIGNLSDAMAVEQSDLCRDGEHMMEDLFSEEVAARIVNGRTTICTLPWFEVPCGGLVGPSRAIRNIDVFAEGDFIRVYIWTG